MKINLNESKLKQIVAESVKNILSEARKPKDAYFGGYFFEGIGFDRNGNPIYSSKHLPIEVMDVLGWRKSSKWGRCGYATDWDIRHALKELDLPFGNDEEEYYNSLNEAISPDYRSALKQLFVKSFSNLDDNEKQFLYDLLSNETWETVYVALETLKPYNPNNEVNEGKTVNNKPIFARGNKKILPGHELGDSWLNAGDFLKLKGYDSFWDAKRDVERGELDKEIFEKWCKEYKNAVEKHNERTFNNDILGRDYEEPDRLAVDQYDDDDYIPY